MTIFHKNITIQAVLFFTLVGCAQVPEHLRTLLDAGKYQDAADAVVGDPPSSSALAAMILEKAAATNQHRFYALERLSAAGDIGLRSLERLASGADETGRAAWVAFNRYDMPDAQAIAACLVDESADVRRMCAFVWHRYFKEDHLQTLLFDSDPTVRLYALKGLAALPADSRTDMFSDVLLRDPSSKVSMEAARRGDLLGDDALLLLVDLLKDDRPGMRVAAVAGIARIGTEPARDLLASVAVAPLDEVALNAAAALAAMGDPLGKTRLIEALHNNRPAMRAAALYLLPRANMPNATALIIRKLDDTAPGVVLAAANLLRNDASLREKIIGALNRISNLKTTEMGHARNLLALLGDKPAEKQIADVLKEPSLLTDAELSSLLGALTGAVGLFDDVVPLMGDPREAVRVDSAVFVLFSMSKI